LVKSELNKIDLCLDTFSKSDFHQFILFG
jgi:hypothetical protein